MCRLTNKEPGTMTKITEHSLEPTPLLAVILTSASRLSVTFGRRKERKNNGEGQRQLVSVRGRGDRQAVANREARCWPPEQCHGEERKNDPDLSHFGRRDRRLGEL